MRCRHRVDDLGPQDHRGDLAGVPATLVPLRDDDVDAGRNVVTGVLDGTGQRGDGDAVAVRLRDDVIGRGPARWR